MCRSSLWRLQSDFFLFDFFVTSEKLAATLEKALAPVITTRGGAEREREREREPVLAPVSAPVCVCVCVCVLPTLGSRLHIKWSKTLSLSKLTNIDPTHELIYL